MQYWPATHQFPAKNFKGKHEKLALSRRISNTKRKVHWNRQKEKKVRKSKARDFSKSKLIQIQVTCLCNILFWALPKASSLVKHRDFLACVVVCNFWKLSLDSLKARHLIITTFFPHLTVRVTVTLLADLWTRGNWRDIYHTTAFLSKTNEASSTTNYVTSSAYNLRRRSEDFRGLITSKIV